MATLSEEPAGLGGSRRLVQLVVSFLKLGVTHAPTPETLGPPSGPCALWGPSVFHSSVPSLSTAELQAPFQGGCH